MEWNEKLQELRKQKRLTQEELAERLYVSRTAISKWESGRGYPNIDSLKAISKFFEITIDELLSGDELLTIAEEETKQKEARFRDPVLGLLDFSIVLLLFLPFFATKANGVIQSGSLLTLDGIQPYLKYTYLIAVIGKVIMGLLLLTLQNVQTTLWQKSKTVISLTLGAILILLLIISSQPYAAAFAFALLLIQGFILIRRS